MELHSYYIPEYDGMQDGVEGVVFNNLSKQLEIWGGDGLVYAFTELGLPNEKDWLNWAMKAWKVWVEFTKNNPSPHSRSTVDRFFSYHKAR